MRRGNVRPERPIDAPATAGASWYRQPIAWLAALILCVSLAAVVATIVVAQRYPDEPVPATGARVLKAPVNRSVDPTPHADSEPAE
jgi:hypothetical protein